MKDQVRKAWRQTHLYLKPHSKLLEIQRHLFLTDKAKGYCQVPLQTNVLFGSLMTAIREDWISGLGALTGGDTHQRPSKVPTGLGLCHVGCGDLGMVLGKWGNGTKGPTEMGNGASEGQSTRGPRQGDRCSWCGARQRTGRDTVQLS